MHTKLDRQMSEPADTEDSESLSTLRLSLHKGAIDRYACTKKRCGLLRWNRVRNLCGMSGRRFDVFRIAAIDGNAGNFLFYAEILIAFTAELAFAAGPVNPGHTDAVANFQFPHTRTNFSHFT